MALKQIRITRIDTDRTSTQNSLSVDGIASRYFGELNQSLIRRAGKDFGSFNTGSATKDKLDKFQEGKMNFANLTDSFSHSFQQLAESANLKPSPFVLFALENLEGGERLHCHFLTQNQSCYINNNSELEPSLSLSHEVSLGFRINLGELYGGDKEISNRAVTLYRAKGDRKLTTWLEEAIGFGNKQDIGGETEKLLESVSAYTKALPEELANFAKAQVAEYCLEQDKAGEPVAINALSNELHERLEASQHNFIPPQSEPYTPPPKFENFLQDNKLELKNEVIADKNKIRNFMRISGRNEQLSMSFSSSCLGESVVYDAASDSLIVKSIPASLKTRLLKLIQSEH